MRVFFGGRARGRALGCRYVWGCEVRDLAPEVHGHSEAAEGFCTRDSAAATLVALHAAFDHEQFPT